MPQIIPFSSPFTMLRRLTDRASWLLWRTPYRHWKKAALRTTLRARVADRRAAFGDRKLDPLQLQIVDGLRRNGYADASGLLDPTRLARLDAATNEKVRVLCLREESRLNGGKDFWERLLDEDQDAEGRQPSTSPYVQVAIDERVLEVVGAYFGDAPLLDYIYLLHSTHKPGPLRVSQLWHRDYDDTNILKLFIYLTDCETEACGPFTFLPADESRRIGFRLHSHLRDDELGITDLASKKINWLGKRLSARFVDTGRCLHMGSRVQPEHERVLYMAAFATYPKFNGRPTNRFALSGNETELQRTALSYP